MEDTRVQILKFIEKNCKVDPKELAVLLGTDEATVLWLSYNDRLG